MAFGTFQAEGIARKVCPFRGLEVSMNFVIFSGKTRGKQRI